MRQPGPLRHPALVTPRRTFGGGYVTGKRPCSGSYFSLLLEPDFFGAFACDREHVLATFFGGRVAEVIFGFGRRLSAARTRAEDVVEVVANRPAPPLPSGFLRTTRLLS